MTIDQTREHLPVIYSLPSSVGYLGQIDGQWYVWPAEAHGWRKRRAVDDIDGLAELRVRYRLDAHLTRLALHLSGVKDSE